MVIFINAKSNKKWCEMGLFYKILFTFLMVFCTKGFALEWINYTSGNHISAIASHGDSIWVGTWGGLVVVNVKTDQISLLNKTNSGLKDNAITALAGDSNGNVFVGSRWLQRCARNNWLNFPLLYDDQSYWIYSISIDINNNLFVGDGLYLRKFDGIAWDSILIGSPIMPFFTISSIAFDKKENVLVGTSQGLYVLNNMIIIKTIPSLGEINSILADTSGLIWVGTTKGLKGINSTTWEISKIVDTLITGTDISCMCYDSKKDLWLGAPKGLIMLDGLHCTYNPDSSKALDGLTITSLNIDGYNNKWIGTRDNSLLKFDGINWKKYNTSNSGLFDNWLHSMTVDNFGNAWVCDASGIVRFDGLNWASYDYTSFTNSFDTEFTRIFVDSAQAIWIGSDIALVYAKNPHSYYFNNTGKKNKSGKIKHDNNGIIWLARNNGLWRYDGLKWNVNNKDNSSMQSDDVGQIMISDDNRVWLTNNNDRVLMSFDGQQWKIIYTCDSGYWISAIVLDKKANPWIGIRDLYTIGKENGQGVLHYNGQKWDSFTISNSALPSNSVTDLEFDSTGNLWVGAYGGMAKYDGINVWTAYTMQNSGLPDNSVEGIEIDNAGNKWIKTQFGGLAVFREGGVVLKTINNIFNEHSFNNKIERLSLKFKGKILYLGVAERKDQEEPDISMYTISGKLIYRFSNIKAVRHNNTYFYSLPQLSKGIYVIKCKYYYYQAYIRVVIAGKL